VFVTGNEARGPLIPGINRDLTNVSVSFGDAVFFQGKKNFLRKNRNGIAEGGDKVFERGTLGI